MSRASNNSLGLAYPQIGRSKEPTTHRVYAKGDQALKLKARKVSALVNRAYKQMSWLREEHRPLVARWAELEIIIRCAFAGICQTGMFSIDGDTREVGVKRLVHDYRQLVQTQTVIARELLITPAAAAQLHGESPVDLVGMMACAAGEQMVEPVEPEPVEGAEGEREAEG